MRAVLATLILMVAMPVVAASPPGDGYQSTIADYLPYREAPLAGTGWRAANEAMGPAHGRMGHEMDNPAQSGGGTAVMPESIGTDSRHHRMGGRP